MLRGVMTDFDQVAVRVTEIKRMHHTIGPSSSHRTKDNRYLLRIQMTCDPVQVLDTDKTQVS